MPKTKPPRNKRYNPKSPKAMGGRTPITFGLSKSTHETLMIVPHQSLDLIRRGVGTMRDWNTIAVRVNQGRVSVERFRETNPEALQVMVDGVLALQTSKARIVSRHEPGTITADTHIAVSGDEFRALGAALNLTDDIQLSLTRRELLEDMNRVQKLNAILRSGKPPAAPAAPEEECETN